MRPRYNSPWLADGRGFPYLFNADLHLVDWLIEHGYDFDVMADEDLHREGRELLEAYNVVLTGTHPEYWSLQMIRATQDYLAGGGRLMGGAMGCTGSQSPAEKKLNRAGQRGRLLQ